ncbi:hypothetical protein SKAU_G00423250 [Synaphobranchus kaupii]|uniref:Gypsy retrotransposon integrase-like protein 1 n=1 Tax=Synaphobranchus kaupii TaxID=118154 RepID=A0A9Q1IAH7_SYNKA|nr:hypothetical protein SKAU_G00423250 [Synaphobranchus kaupii]
MEFSFPPPSHFLALPGEPPVPWTRWYEAFETYISVLGVEDLSAARKRAMLIHCLCIEGQRIFKTLGAAADYVDCVRLLAGHFAAPKNVYFANASREQKKSGGLRVCVDLRAVNKAVIPDKYPLPTVEELTTQFYGATTFSKLDLRQGNLQVPLHPDSRNLAAFVSHAGVFRYARMPFGLSSSLVFRRLCPPSLQASPGWSYTSTTLWCTVQCLHQVLSVLAKHNLTLNEEKCVFSVAAVEFVGFRLTAEGLSPPHSNVDAVQRLPEPICPAQVASFLGMMAYYLRFLPQYSTTTAPLRELLKKDVPWVWTRACSTAVRQLKAQLTSPPVLAHFDLSSPTILTCDASNRAVGAVLSQLHRGTERPIAFASRALSPAEQKYSVGEREALTALLATSGTGHRPLRIHRWSERLQQYNFTPQFTPGRENVVADLLSRATPCPPPSQDPDHRVTEPDLIQMLHTPLQTTVSLQDLQQASEQDPVLSQLRAFIRTGWPPKVSEELAPFYRVREELSCWGDVCVARGLRTVVPSCLRARILLMAHEGHLGIVKVKQRCRDLVWWPAIDRDIEAMVRDCTACLEHLDWTRRWEHLMPLLRSKRADIRDDPDVMVINLGGNSIGTYGNTRISLMRRMKADIR